MSSRFKLKIPKYISHSSCYLKTGLTKPVEMGDFFHGFIEIDLFLPKGEVLVT